jgi:hypothetical protein
MKSHQAFIKVTIDKWLLLICQINMHGPYSNQLAAEKKLLDCRDW